MKHKVTDEDFQYFISQCKEWINRFSLHEIDVIYRHEPNKGSMAAHAANYGGRKTTMFLSTSWTSPVTKFELDRCAFHEVCHALFVAVNAQVEVLYNEDHIAREHEVINKLWRAMKEIDDGS